MAPKKSPNGTDTAGDVAPSQNMSRRTLRRVFGSRSGSVIQMRRTVPLPVTLSSVLVSPAANGSKAWPFAVLLSEPALPLAADGFSNVAQRVFESGRF